MFRALRIAIVCVSLGNIASCARAGSLQSSFVIPVSVGKASKPVLVAPAQTNSVTRGRSLFLKNCAHCHADDAHGDEGPDLHKLKRSDDFITRRIRNGVKGEMTAFTEKFNDSDIKSIISFLRTLN